MDINSLAQKPYGELTSAERRLLAKVSKQFRIIKRSESVIQKMKDKIVSLKEEIESAEKEQVKRTQEIKDAKLVIAAVERASSVEEATKETTASDNSVETSGEEAVQ